MLGLRKPNFKTKINPFENLTMPKTVKGGPMKFFNIPSVAKFQKTEGGPFGVLRKIFERKQKMRHFNSLIVPEI